MAAAKMKTIGNYDVLNDFGTDDLDIGMSDAGIPNNDFDACIGSASGGDDNSTFANHGRVKATNNALSRPGAGDDVEPNTSGADFVAHGTHKKISGELDEIDSIIVDLKNKGHDDSYVSDFLVKRGRIKYDKKTIATRYMRIKQIWGRDLDERLEHNLEDWHEGEDEILFEAYAQAHMRMEKEIIKIKSKKWAYTLEAMIRIKPALNYSDVACRKRYIALMNDEATIPIELDDNPAERRQEQEDRLREYTERRTRAKAEADAIKAKEQKEKLMAEIARAEKLQANANKRAKDAEEKAKKAATRAAIKQANADKMEAKRKERELKSFKLARMAMENAQKKPGQLSASSSGLALVDADEEDAMDADTEETPVKGSGWNAVNTPMRTRSGRPVQQVDMDNSDEDATVYNGNGKRRNKQSPAGKQRKRARESAAKHSIADDF